MSGPKPKARLGETNVMKNGMVAKILRYKSSAEIDVQFEDGVVVTNKTYASFAKGLIGHPAMLHKSKVKNRIGDIQKMSNGMDAIIIRYESAKDMDVEFEDGSIREHVSYKEFKAGHIAHPSQTSAALAEQRIGEERKMNCGATATITKYNSYHDIEITFEDGIVVPLVDYGQFSNGLVCHPELDGNISLQEAAVVFYLKEFGFVKQPRGSLKDLGLGNFELDLYHNDCGVAIEIDGHFHKGEAAVKRDVEKNLKCHKAGITLYRLRNKELPILEDGLSHNYVLDGNQIYNGLCDCKEILCTILKRIGIPLPTEDFIDFARDLDAIRRSHSTTSFNYTEQKKIGEKVWHKTTCQFMTIIEYKDYFHITVQFDDGEIANDKNYGSFLKGEIKHPKQTPAAKRLSRLGESKMMNCGNIATITAYRNAEDMDVVFEDGVVRYGVTYCNFQRGNIAKNKKRIKSR